MSSEWWSILVVFWGLYLADGLRGGRRDRFHFHGWCAARSERLVARTVRKAKKKRRGNAPPHSTRILRPNGRATQASWFFIPPIPTGWALTAGDLPASLAPEGLTNWPSVSAARPPPLPESVATHRWEDITTVEDRGGWIFINGVRFTPSTPGLTATALGELVRELAPLPASARTVRLQAWHRARFCPDRLRRRLRVALGRSRDLVALNAMQTLLLAATSAYLLFDGPNRVNPDLRDTLARALPSFLIAFVLLHLSAVGWFYRLHRRIHPHSGQERASLVFTALFVPAQALRLRLHLSAKLAGGYHPLAVALAVGGPAATRELAVNTLRDLRWPRFATGIPGDALRIVRASSALLEPIVIDLLARRMPPLPPGSLLAAPARESSATCAYCPRCGDQFTRMDACCPHGVPLVPFARPSVSRKP